MNSKRKCSYCQAYNDTINNIMNQIKKRIVKEPELIIQDIDKEIDNLLMNIRRKRDVNFVKKIRPYVWIFITPILILKIGIYQ
jgi:hypothetical protein